MALDTNKFIYKKIKEEKFGEKELVHYFFKGISAASAIKEVDFQNWIPKIEDLEYKKMYMLAGIMI